MISVSSTFFHRTGKNADNIRKKCICESNYKSLVGLENHN